MIARRATLLTTAAAVLAATAAALLARTGPPMLSTLPAPRRMFPDLPERAARARRIEILRQGRRLVLARSGADHPWVLPDHASYPARADAPFDLLASLGSLMLLERRTSDPNLFAQLGLGDPASPATTSTLVRVLDGDGTPLAAVLLGNAPTAGPGPDGRYVRAPDAAQTWLAEAPLDVSTDWLDWVDRRILDILPEDVTSVVSQRGEDPRLVVERRDGHLALTQPADHPPLDDYRLDDMLRALSDLELLDVRRAADLSEVALGEAVVTTVSGLAVRARVGRGEGRTWLRLSVEGAAPGAEALRRRLAPWAFAVEARVGDALVPALSDLTAFRPAAWAPPAAPQRPRPAPRPAHR